MGGLDSFCQIKNGTSSAVDPAAEAALFRLKATFRTIIVVISTLGVAGNVLNLITLRSPSLRNVPFMFIRALALFDLISLLSILLLFALETLQIEADAIIFYEVWVQDVIINSFLVAGLYCAVLLTIERFLLIRKPLSSGFRLLSIENTVIVKIGMALLAAILLHSPMALQFAPKCAEYALAEGQEADGLTVQEQSSPRCLHWTRGKFNNRDLLCREPFFALYNYYKMGRELLRFSCVLLLIFLNAVIARHLQMAKRKRRLLTKRASMATTVNSEPSGEKHGTPGQNGHAGHHPQNTLKRGSPPNIERAAGNNGTSAPSGSRREQLNTLMRSFTEKKLTALMVAICVIFAIGNIPQMVVMAVQNEALDNAFSFQVFRQVANTAEVLNHCLNFFIFCMASSEYCRAFLSLSAVRWCLRHCPLCASLARARLSGRLDNSHLVINGAAHESVSDCVNIRKKSSIGTATGILVSSENGGWSSNGNNGGTVPQRYRRECANANAGMGNGHNRSQWSQRSLVGAVIVERKSSSTLTNCGASLEWPAHCEATVQLVGGAASEESGGGAGGGGADDFL